MSLYKQLWLSIVFLMSLAFTGSFIVSGMSAKGYLEEQLTLKNIDNANSLALTIANTATDDVTMKLMISAQFDTGHYQYIRLVGVDGKVIMQVMDKQSSSTVPEWFTQLLKIEAQHGIAQIQRGWQQIGTLSLASHDTYAYQSLWNSSIRLFNYCIVIAVLSGLIGSLLLKVILRPLADTISQANAISNRQFVVVDEPRTLEFKEVARSMNTLSLRIKAMMEDESAKLHRLQKGALFDEVTSLPNREHFLNILSASLEADDSHSSGVLVITRLQNMTELNRHHGRQLMNLLLARIGSALLEQGKMENNWQIGRLNGSDFAVLACAEHDPVLIAHRVQDTLLATLQESDLPSTVDLPTAACSYHPGEQPSLLLSKTDAALASAEQQGSNAVEVADAKLLKMASVNLEDWKQLLESAFSNNYFSLAKFPVVDKHQKLIHEECPARLSTPHGDVLNGGQFIPWVNRFNLGIKLDDKIIDMALEQLTESKRNLCINLSASSLSDEHFLSSLVNRLSADPELASRLWMEIPEHSAYQNLAGFKQFCRRIKPLGCHIGIEHVGHHISKIGEIHDLGLDYIKIDASITGQVDSTPAHQVLLRGLCIIVHSVGLIAIAEGVHNRKQWDTLKELGIDGGTGSLITTLYDSTP